MTVVLRKSGVTDEGGLAEGNELFLLCHEIIEDEAGYDEGREERGQDPCHKCDGEAFDRPDAERVQNNADKQRGYVGVNNGTQGFRISRINGRFERSPGGEFFP